MENIKIKRAKGRPAYIENLEQLQKLYTQIDNGEITNEEAWKTAGCGKTKWYNLKKSYCRTGGKG